MSVITIRRGKEGPRHDSYSFEEITVQRSDGRSVMLHTGLALWAKGYDADGEVYAMRVNKAAVALFIEIAGITPHQAEKAACEFRERRYRYHPCGLRYLKDVDGFPGETLVFCGKCGDVVDMNFNINAII